MDRARLSPTSRPLICLVTDRRVLADSGGDEILAVNQLLDVIADCAAAGVDLVQIREPGLSDRCLLDLVRAAMDCTRATAARVLVNDRPDVALAAGAAGVHLKDDERDAARVRALGPRGWIVGRSVHDVAAARRAEESGAVDYLVAGTVFRSASKPGRPPLGLEALRDIARACTRPVLAIGGVGLDEGAAVAAAGAAGVAGIRLFEVAPRTKRRARVAMRVESLRAAFDRRGALD
jgi:thiamine-phosphate pyrophosphorylase